MGAKSKTSKNIVSCKRGWDALEKMLRERKMTETELKEARDSFHKGIDLLSRMFLSQAALEKR